MASPIIRLRLGPFRGEPWSAAIYTVRWGLAAGILYPVLCTIVALLLALGELEATAAHGPVVVERIPYWRVVP